MSLPDRPAGILAMVDFGAFPNSTDMANEVVCQYLAPGVTQYFHPNIHLVDGALKPGGTYQQFQIGNMPSLAAGYERQYHVTWRKQSSIANPYIRFIFNHVDDNNNWLIDHVNGAGGWYVAPGKIIAGAYTNLGGATWAGSNITSVINHSVILERRDYCTYEMTSQTLDNMAQVTDLRTKNFSQASRPHQTAGRFRILTFNHDTVAKRDNLDQVMSVLIRDVPLA